MNNMYVLFILLSAFGLHVIDAAKILVAFPMPSRSHAILGDGIVNNLLEAGHEVTYITTVVIKNPPSNLHIVDISSNMDLLPKDTLNVKKIMDEGGFPNSISIWFLICYYLTKGTIDHENVQALINDRNQKFDAVIIEYMFNPMLAGFSQIFQCPLIWFTSVEPNGAMLRLIDEMTNPAYAMEVTFKHTHPLTFFQRVSQLVFQIHFTVFNGFLTYTFNHWGYTGAFGPAAAQRGISLPHLSEVELSGSLMLSNSHISLGSFTQLPQNCKPIGGYHIKENTQPLPEDLKNIMDNAKNGVIYFSMGSNIKSKDLPDNIKKELLDMFGNLKQTVIWKFEEVLTDLPKNVHIQKWTPQHSILAHSNCILFITHGGLLSTTETVHFGVPIIGIPVFGDQFINIQKAELKGFAVEVPLNYDLPSNLKVAIDKVINNSSYRGTAKRLSTIYHDRPVPPAKEMVHWVEHVIRTNGAPHLRSIALMTPLYQKLYLDLIALLACVTYGLFKLKKFVLSTKKTKVKKN